MNIIIESLRRIKNDEKGQALAETAILGLMLVTFVLGMLLIVDAINVKQTVTKAAIEGGRAAMVSQSPQSDAQTVVEEMLKNRQGFLQGRLKSVTVDDVSLPAIGYLNRAIKVTVTYEIRVPLLSGSPLFGNQTYIPVASAVTMNKWNNAILLDLPK